MSTPSYLDELVFEPPTMRLRTNEGETVTEELVIVASIEASADQREQLELYGVCMDHALHDPKAGVWTRCLLSEPCLRMLLELVDEGQFPFKVLTSLSQAEAEWRIARAAGAIERAPVPRRAYVTPASIEVLVRLNAVSESKR